MLFEIGLFIGGVILGGFWFNSVIFPLFYGFPRSFLWATRRWVRWYAPLRYLVSAIFWPFAFLGCYLVLGALLPRPAAFMLQSKFFWAGQVGGFLFATAALFRQSARVGIRIDYLDYVHRYLTQVGISAVDTTMTIEYLRLEILMDFDLQLGRGRAAVRWQPLKPHLTLSGEQTRIALAALQYARILIVHGETTGELFHRIATGAQGLIDGDPFLALDPWQLETDGLPLQLWPWAMGRPEELKGSSMYVATLDQSWKGNLDIHLQMSWGQEQVLAPSSVLIGLYTLARSLDADGRILLGRTIRAMNEHLIKTGTLGKLGSDEEALEAAMPVLLNRH